MHPLPHRLRDLSFWHFQIGGWLCMAVLQVSIALASTGGWDGQMLSSVILEVVLAFFLTSLLRYLYRHVRYQILSLFSMISLIVVCSAGVAVMLFGFFLFLDPVTGGTTLPRDGTMAIPALLFIAYAFPDVLAWSGLYFGIRFWRDWQAERAQADRAIEEVQRAQLQALRYRLNPRLLFDTLNTVKTLVGEDDSSARQLVTELAELLRYSLLSRKRPLVPLKDELEAIRLSLSIERRRHRESPCVTFAVASETGEVSVPSFAIYPLVEHALRCVKQANAEPPQIRIESGLRENVLHLTVAYNGGEIGSEREESELRQRTGLEQAEARFRDLLPHRYRLTSHQQDGKTILTLDLALTSGVPHEDTVTGDHR